MACRGDWGEVHSLYGRYVNIGEKLPVISLGRLLYEAHRGKEEHPFDYQIGNGGYRSYNNKCDL